MSSSSVSFVTTADGSKTLFNPEVGENYHSINGAYQESLHVFVHSGLRYYQQLQADETISILEVGFGTGLNFLLSAEYAIANNIRLNYKGIEAFPLPQAIIADTSYQELLKNQRVWEAFLNNYNQALSTTTNIDQEISLEIIPSTLLTFESELKFDIIYFDAFAKVHQPEMWTEESIQKACSFLKDKGIFVTYSVTGDLKRTLKSLGFEIERPEGAAGKREMMRATFINKNAL